MAVPRQTRLPKVTNYVKNVGKSVAYASVDYLKSNASGIADFLDVNADIMKEGYKYAKNWRETSKKVDRDFRRTNVYKALNAGMNNFKEDLKTGNFWNVDREKAVAEEALGLDMDFDFDFESSGSSNKKEPSATAVLADSFNQAIGRAAATQTSIAASGTKAMLTSNAASTKLLMGGLEKLGAQFGSSIGALYTQVARTNKFLEGPVMTHMENSRKFYDTSTRLMQEQTAMMKEMLEMQRNLYKVQQTKHPDDRVGQSMRYNGSIDIRGYIKNVKGNFKDLLDNTGLGMMDMADLGGGNPFMLFAAAPMKIVMQSIMDRVISKDFKRALQSFDKSMTSIFSQFVARLNKKAKEDNDGGLKGILYEILGVKQDVKNNINTSKFNKGPVPFDGITRRTIIEVIPGYLARIEAALTGRGERFYDTNSGTWKSATRVRDEFNMEKQRAVLNANSYARADIQSAASKMDQASGKRFVKHSDKAFTRIFDDGGDFDPKRKDAWKYYGFKSEKEFKLFRDSISYDSFRSMAINNMNSRTQLSKRMRDVENSDSLYRILFSGAFDESGTGNGTRNDPTKYSGGTGILAASRDKEGRNIFWYLKEILNTVSRNHRDNLDSNIVRNTRSRARSSRTRSASFTSLESGSEEDGSDDDEGSISDEVIDDFNRDEAERKEKEAKQKAFGTWFSKKLENTRVGRALLDASSGIGRLMAKPMQYATELLNKADKGMFSMMFGDNFEMKDRKGNKIDSVFKFIVTKVKETFEDLGKSIKAGLKKYLFESKFWKEYVKPFGESVKTKVRGGVDRVKGAFKNVFESFRRQPGVTEDDVADGVEESAYGRYVGGNKPILSMLSPGEIVIPASFDDAYTSKQLQQEKRSKNNILRAIKGAKYHAKGTIDPKDIYKWLKGESRGKGSKIAAGGALGGIGGLVAGVNPILGALVGSAVSFISESEGAKNFLFGKERDGSGVIPKKAFDFFKKHGKSMGDFGIVGGILGLLTPFGVLGGAAMGAGIGYLKNSESFKKFIFGDEEMGKDGLIKKETFDKFKQKVKDAAPNLIAGAGLGILAGPFGLIGNAAMGAGLGLLTSTETFHKAMFGDKENDPNDKGLMGAFEAGVIDPVKDQMKKFAESFKGYAKKNILDPMKNFWNPFQQMLKNTITSVGDRVTDFFKRRYENTIGRPIADLVQNKILKPITRTVLKVIKAPVAIGKAVVAAPFRALGAIGNSIRMNQIRKGKATDMTAADRIAFREAHKGRDNFSHFMQNDKMREQDDMLAQMSDEDVEKLAMLAQQKIEGREAAGKRLGKARKDAGRDISNFMNQKVANGKNLYDLVGYGYADKIYKAASNGDMDKVTELIDKAKGIDKEQKTQLIAQLESKVNTVRANMRETEFLDMDGAETDKMLEDLFGRPINDIKDLRNVLRNAKSEVTNRHKQSVDSKIADRMAEDAKTPEEKTVDRLEKSNTILERIHDILYRMVYGKDPKKGTATGDALELPEASDSAPKSMDDVIEIAPGRYRDKKSGRFVGKNTILELQSKNETNEDSKEAIEAEDEAEEAQETEERETSAIENINNQFREFIAKLLGSKEKKDHSGGIVGKFFKYLGIGAKVGAGLVGVSLFGHASEWFKTDIWPKIKKTLMGDKESGEQGVVGKILGWFGEKFNKVKEWLNSKGGFGNLIYTTLSDKVIPYLIEGFGYAVDNVIAPLTALLIKSAPKILVGLVKGLIKGLGMAIFNKDLPRTQTVDDGGVTKEIQALSNSNRSSLTSNMPSAMAASLNKSFSGGRSSSAYSGAGFEIDFSDLNKDTNNVKKKGLMGVLGATERTNDVVMDENGNIVTTYTQNAETDSAASKIAKASGRGFLQGLSGSVGAGSKLMSRLAKIKVLPKKMSRVFTLNPLKWGYRGAKAGTKIAGVTVGGATNLGTKLRNLILGNTDEVADAAVNSVDDVAEAATKPGLFSRIKNFFGKTAAGAEEVLDNANLDPALKPGKTTLWQKLTSKISGSKLGQKVSGAVDGLKNTAKNKATSILDGAKTAVANSKPGQLVSKLVEGMKGLFKKFSEGKIGSWFCKVGKKLIGEKFAKTAFFETLENFAEKLAKKAATKLVGGAMKSVLNAIGGMTPLALLFILNDLISGYRNAETILGVANTDEEYEVGIIQRLACALIHAINQRITLGLLPTEIIMDLVIEFIFPFFGINAEKLNAARDRATEILDQWNKENPDQTYDNLEDYNKKDRLWSKIKRFFKKDSGKLTLENEDGSDGSTNGSSRGKSFSGKSRRLVGGAGHLYQGNRAIANMRYGDSTIGRAGCAPVAAANLVNSYYGTGSLADAASYAERHGMTVRGGGTDIDYFNSYLGSKGIPTRNTSNRGEVLNALRNGQQVVMLGTNGSNYRGAPFGANDHFITAKGIDRRGNIIVEDPDLPQSRVSYSKNKVLSSMTRSVIAGKSRSGRGSFSGDRTGANSTGGRFSTNNLGPNAIINVAASQIGVNDGGCNRVKYNNAYWNTANKTSGKEYYGNAYPWCCAFIWWVFNQAGASHLFYNGGFTAGCTQLRNYHWKNGQRVDTPQAGDIVFFDWSGVKSAAQHVGIVTGVDNATGMILTIEGNTSSNGSQDNGGYVMAKQRSPKYISGYYRPKYPYTYNASSVVNMSAFGDSTDYKEIALNGGEMTGDTVSFADSNTYASSASGSSESNGVLGSLWDSIKNLGTSIIKAFYGEDKYNAIFGEADSDDGGANTPGDSGLIPDMSELSGNTDSQKIWSYLRDSGYSKEATAGIMGNLYAESGLRSNNLQNNFESKYGNDAAYTADVDSGSRSRSAFKSDSAGYGLAQWTYHTRKAGLYDHLKGSNKSIADLGGQLSWLTTELANGGYPKQMANMRTVEDASDYILKNFERPAVLNYEKRREYSRGIYEQFKDYTPTTSNSDTSNVGEDARGSGRGRGSYTGSATAALKSYSTPQYYGGAGGTTTRHYTGTVTKPTGTVDYETFLQTVVSILMSIANNTAILSKILTILSKEFDINIDKSDIDKAHMSTLAQTESALNRLVARSSDNNRNLSKILNGKDTSYILSAMSAIASE